MKLRTLCLVVVALLAGCGDDDEESVATPETVTVTETEPPTEAPPKPAKAKVDPAERQNSIYLALDDDAVALDNAIGLALDGNESAIRSLGRIRQLILDHNFQWAQVSGELTNRPIAMLSGAATDAKVAAESGDLRRLVEARVAGHRARGAVTKFFFENEP